MGSTPNLFGGASAGPDGQTEKSMKKLLIIIPTIVITAAAIIFHDSLLAPLRFTWYSNRAQFHEARKEYDKAIHEYTLAAAIYREDQIMKHLVGVYRRDMKRFGDEPKDAVGPMGGEEKALSIVRRSPENPYAHITLANYYLSRYLLRDARKSFNTAVGINPNVKYSIAASLGRLEFEERRDIPKATKHYEFLCGDNESCVTRHSILIKLYFLGGKSEKKKKLLSSFVEKHQRTRSPGLLEGLGYAHLALGQYSEASSVFLKAIRNRRPSTDTVKGQLTADAHLMLMRAGQIARAQPEMALALIARAMQNDPSLWKDAGRIIDKNNFAPGRAGYPPEFHYVLAKSYGEKGRVDAMARECRFAIEKNPAYFEPVAELEKIYAEMNRPGEIAALRGSAQRHQTTAFTWKNLIGANRGNLYSSGDALITDVKLLSGRVTVNVQARGSQAAGEFPSMAVFVDGIFIGAVPVEKQPKWYSFETSVATGRHIIAIRFPNDLVMGREDRNLFINAIKIGRK